MAAAAAAAAASLTSPLLFSPLFTPKLTPCFQNPNPNRGTPIRTLKITASSSSPPKTGCPVPYEQQPVNEYQSLSTSLPFSWPAADVPLYCSRLAATGFAFALLLGLPVATFGTRSAAASFDLQVDGVRWAAECHCGV